MLQSCTLIYTFAIPCVCKITRFYYTSNNIRKCKLLEILQIFWQFTSNNVRFGICSSIVVLFRNEVFKVSRNHTVVLRKRGHVWRTCRAVNCDKKFNLFADISSSVVPNLSQQTWPVAHKSLCNFVFKRECENNKILIYVWL